MTDSPQTGLILLLVAFIMHLYVACSDPTPRMDGHLPKSSQLPSFSPGFKKKINQIYTSVGLTAESL